MGHAGPIALENVVQELVAYGQQVEHRRNQIREMETRTVAERIAESNVAQATDDPPQQEGRQP